jgi:hypothetical protein
MQLSKEGVAKCLILSRNFQRKRCVNPVGLNRGIIAGMTRSDLKEYDYLDATVAEGSIILKPVAVFAREPGWRDNWRKTPLSAARAETGESSKRPDAKFRGYAPGRRPRDQTRSRGRADPTDAQNLASAAGRKMQGCILRGYDFPIEQLARTGGRFETLFDPFPVVQAGRHALHHDPAHHKVVPR